jgi:hypothetical protein
MNIPQLLKALEFDIRGDWEEAHKIVQRLNSKAAYRVHAYLHRKEGDLGNAAYWYARADSSMPSKSLEGEWEELKMCIDRL